MSNPWLAVPLSEYEQHMSSVEVQQLGALSDLFAEAIGCCRPFSIAVLGIAGGNGLDHIDSSITARVVGLDLNPCTSKPSGSAIRTCRVLSSTASICLNGMSNWSPSNLFTRL